MCVKIRKIQKSRKSYPAVQRERREKKRTHYYLISSHNDDNVCENQKNPKTPEKSNLAVQREREEKKNEPTIIQSHLIMMMIMCVKIRKIQKSRKIES